MPLIPALIVCVGLWLLFPKGFKYMVGTWMGVISGLFVWCICALVWYPKFFHEYHGWHIIPNPVPFLGFIITGIVAGCILAAKG